MLQHHLTRPEITTAVRAPEEWWDLSRRDAETAGACIAVGSTEARQHPGPSSLGKVQTVKCQEMSDRKIQEIPGQITVSSRSEMCELQPEASA